MPQRDDYDLLSTLPITGEFYTFRQHMSLDSIVEAINLGFYLLLIKDLFKLRAIVIITHKSAGKQKMWSCGLFSFFRFLEQQFI